MLTQRTCGLFVTGTDTGVGKTRVALALMRSLRACGLKVLGMKPVATGCERVEGALRNDDALRLQHAGSVAVAYELVNPYAFLPPIAPSVAARLAGRPIDLAVVAHRYHELRAQCDRVIVEGVGGWEVPLNDRQRVSDLASYLGLPVILVVGLRLGCLNHALLTEAAIRAKGVPYRGWVANSVTGDVWYPEENLATLRTCLRGTFLGALAYSQEAEDPASDVANWNESINGLV